MLNAFKKKAQAVIHNLPIQAITPTVLATAMETALNSAFNNYATSDVDELIAKTGKSRHAVFRACMADDEVTGCIEDIGSSIKAQEWRIYDDVAMGANVSPEIINKFYKYIRRHISAFAQLAIGAKLGGYAIGEYTYAMDNDGFIYIDKVINKKGRLDKFDIKANGQVIYKGDKEEIVNTQVKVLALTHNATDTNPMGEMNIVKIYPAVLLRAKGWAYAGQFIARYAQPYVVGKQGGYSLIADFTSRLFEFINGGATGIGADDDISIHQLNGNGEAFGTFEQLANSRIQKFLLGRVKTSELSSGSRASQETDDKVREDRMVGYLELMVEAIQHAIDAMLLVNGAYGMKINAPQGIWFEYVRQEKIDIERATRDKIYTDTGQIRLTQQYFVDKVGYEPHHFEIVQATPLVTPVSLQLSDNHTHKDNHDHTHHDEPLTAKQAKISQRKVDKILSLFDDVDDFATFQKRLSELDLGDDEFVDELAKQNLQAYVDGLTGKANADGQMGV